MKIMILDSSNLFTRIVQKEIEKFSKEIWIAHDEKEALCHLEEVSFSLIIAGLQLKTSTGINFAKAVESYFRKQGRAKEIPLFLLMSGDEPETWEAKIADTPILGVFPRQFHEGTFVSLLIEKLLASINLNQKKVLVVDDSDLSRQLLVHILQKTGMTVLIANDGSQALLLLEEYKNNINLVISDNYMRMMNGVELFEKMKTIHSYAQIPFVLLTAETSTDVIQKWRDAGMQSILTKPCSKEEILFEICRIFITIPQNKIAPV